MRALPLLIVLACTQPDRVPELPADSAAPSVCRGTSGGECAPGCAGYPEARRIDTVNKCTLDDGQPICTTSEICLGIITCLVDVTTDTRLHLSCEPAQLPGRYRRCTDSEKAAIGFPTPDCPNACRPVATSSCPAGCNAADARRLDLANKCLRPPITICFPGTCAAGTGCVVHTGTNVIHQTTCLVPATPGWRACNPQETALLGSSTPLCL